MAHSILQYPELEERVEALQQFIIIAKVHNTRNYYLYIEVQLQLVTMVTLVHCVDCVGVMEVELHSLPDFILDNHLILLFSAINTGHGSAANVNSQQSDLHSSLSTFLSFLPSLSLPPLPSSTPLLPPQHCMDFRNYSSVMAIVAGLGSSPIRRLHRTWEGVSKQHMGLYKHMDAILDTRVGGNSERSVQLSYHSRHATYSQAHKTLFPRCTVFGRSSA